MKLQENGIEKDLKAVSRPAPIPTVDEVAKITADLESLITEKDCGPIMIRLSWHDVS